MSEKNTYLPANGESPLASLPEYGGAGGSTQAQEYYAGQEFQKLFGRNPTQSELAQFAGAYAGDPNIANTSQGNQAVAQYYNNQSNTPANIYAKQQKQWSQGASQHYDVVNQMTQSVYGRKATQDELDHYGTLIASGQADPYQIQDFLKSTPEYQNTQDTQFRQGVDTQLQKSDTDFFNTQKGNIAQQYAQMGRATSPALDVALTQLASQLNSQRGSYLAQLSASQYGGNKDNATADYNRTKSDVSGRINQNTQDIYGANNAMNSRLQNITDYNTQMNAWNAANKPKSPGTLDYLNVAFKGANSAANAYSASQSGQRPA